VFRHALRSTQTSIQCVLGAHFPTAMELRLRKHGVMLPFPHIFKAWHLIKHRDNFTWQHNLPENKLPLWGSKGRRGGWETERDVRGRLWKLHWRIIRKMFSKTSIDPMIDAAMPQTWRFITASWLPLRYNDGPIFNQFNTAQYPTSHVCLSLSSTHP
jgi:hypothetical protein